MDNSSFPKVLEFRNKIPPNPQLLRLKDWFASYDFTVRHVKDDYNIIADMLSRPPPVHLVTPSYRIPLVLMASSASSLASSSSSSFPRSMIFLQNFFLRFSPVNNLLFPRCKTLPDLIFRSTYSSLSSRVSVMFSPTRPGPF
ncbi:hypothetical protein Dsin_032937 [Dipteronia sinensis]|uniref:Uncharacterized protein n=1 Tax=Dipteronia sinensis TaxID=43782 RepID=A0AAE0DNZ1_9ROSI|nr:hypothetical protein Dsin_032937 [Dipteronia sinensis]